MCIIMCKMNKIFEMYKFTVKEDQMSRASSPQAFYIDQFNSVKLILLLLLLYIFLFYFAHFLKKEDSR